MCAKKYKKTRECVGAIPAFAAMTSPPRKRGIAFAGIALALALTLFAETAFGDRTSRKSSGAGGGSQSSQPAPSRPSSPSPSQSSSKISAPTPSSSAQVAPSRSTLAAPSAPTTMTNPSISRPTAPVQTRPSTGPTLQQSSGQAPNRIFGSAPGIASGIRSLSSSLSTNRTPITVDSAAARPAPAQAGSPASAMGPQAAAGSTLQSATAAPSGSAQARPAGPASPAQTLSSRISTGRNSLSSGSEVSSLIAKPTTQDRLSLFSRLKASGANSNDRESPGNTFRIDNPGIGNRESSAVGSPQTPRTAREQEPTARRSQAANTIGPSSDTGSSSNLLPRGEFSRATPAPGVQANSPAGVEVGTRSQSQTGARAADRPAESSAAKKGLLSLSGRISRKAEPAQPLPDSGAERVRDHQSTEPRIAGGTADGPRPARIIPPARPAIANNRHDRNEIGGYRSAKYGSRHVLYYDRPRVVERPHRYTHTHVYVDWRDRVCHRIIWPRYHFAVGYLWGPSWTVRCVYPYYLRKYVFVSIGGYWPIDYSYIRYYWYGYHPYYWCGYYPVAHQLQGDTYNYYTYNYYYDDDGAVVSEAGPAIGGIETASYATFADARQQVVQQAVEPSQPTAADHYFEEAVKAFEAGDYATAAASFACAMEYAPDDMVLPFAYAQALLAGERYTEAAQVLRSALERVFPEKEGVFFARGLYPDDDVLFAQIASLEEKAAIYSYDADLQLLWGYQLLGIGEVDAAMEPLSRAMQDLQNASAAKVLFDLAEKIRAASGNAKTIVR